MVSICHALVMRLAEHHLSAFQRGEIGEISVLQALRHQQSEVVGGTVVVVVIESARRDKVSVIHSDFCRTLIHKLRKALRAAAYSDRGSVCRVVARGHHHSDSQIAQCDLLAELEVHRAALGCHVLVKRDDIIALCGALKRNQRGHELGRACGFHALVFVL